MLGQLQLHRMENELLKTDDPNLLKDKKTGALLSVDSRGLAARKVLIKKQQEQRKDKEELNSIKEQVDDIQNEMSEIKDLLKAILQK